MVIDTSALICILQMEPEAGTFIQQIESANFPALSAVTLVEASIIMRARRGEDGLHYLDRFIQRANIEIHSVDREQADIARRAYQRFGKGRHAAGLNFGDCFSYALTVHMGTELLCKGNDFAQTDLPLATSK